MAKYYSLKEILKTDSTYHILLGMKGNGKSYSVKDYILQRAYHEKDPFTGEACPDYQFGYLRRWDLENRGADIEQYFSDFVINDDGRRRIHEITGGEYDAISVYQKKIYFSKLDPETDKVIRGKQIGYAFSMSRVSKYSSLAFPNIGCMVYEEFITNEGYQPDEPSRLMILMSTIFRRRNGKVFLIGNTMSRECPYFNEWMLLGVPRQKQGTIDIYKHTTDDGNTIKIAVENCENAEIENKLIIGRKTKMITTGQWDSEEQPHLPEPIEHYRVIWPFFIRTNNLCYFARILKPKEKGEPFIYVCPHTTEIKDPEHTRILSFQHSLNYLHSKRLLTDKVKYDSLILEMFRNGRVVYSDNLTGTEFKNLLKQEACFA